MRQGPTCRSLTADGEWKVWSVGRWHGRCKDLTSILSVLFTVAARRFLPIALIALGMSYVPVQAADAAGSMDAKATAATVAAKEKAKKATSITELRKLYDELGK